MRCIAKLRKLWHLFDNFLKSNDANFPNVNILLATTVYYINYSTLYFVLFECGKHVLHIAMYIFSTPIVLNSM